MKPGEEQNPRDEAFWARLLDRLEPDAADVEAFEAELQEMERQERGAAEAAPEPLAPEWIAATVARATVPEGVVGEVAGARAPDGGLVAGDGAEVGAAHGGRIVAMPRRRLLRRLAIAALLLCTAVPIAWLPLQLVWKPRDPSKDRVRTGAVSELAERLSLVSMTYEQAVAILLQEHQLPHKMLAYGVVIERVRTGIHALQQMGLAASTDSEEPEFSRNANRMLEGLDDRLESAEAPPSRLDGDVIEAIRGMANVHLDLAQREAHMTVLCDRVSAGLGALHHMSGAPEQLRATVRMQLLLLKKQLAQPLRAVYEDSCRQGIQALKQARDAVGAPPRLKQDTASWLAQLEQIATSGKTDLAPFSRINLAAALGRVAQARLGDPLDQLPHLREVANQTAAGIAAVVRNDDPALQEERNQVLSSVLSELRD